MNEVTAAQIAKRCKWFHSIDLGGGEVTPSRFGPNTPPNYTLFGFFDLIQYFDLSRARCFDVGTMDGIAAFIMKHRGAGEVVACDMARRPTFEYAREKLKLDIEYVTPVSALSLPETVGEQKADLVLMAGVLYHVYDPLTVLVACRQSLRAEGFLIVETQYLRDCSQPYMVFNPTDPSPRRVNYPHVYWRPSKSALHGMLELAAFQVVATVVVDSRLTVLAQAKRPRDIASRNALIRRAQDEHRSPSYREMADFDRLQSSDTPPARVRYMGPGGDRFLYRALYRPQVPFQPEWQPESSWQRWRDARNSAGMHLRSKLGTPWGTRSRRASRE